ncbi:MAG: fumarate hydratase [Promethearchaeota archaeon]
MIEDTAITLLELASHDLPRDVEEALKYALEKENNIIAQSQLSSILKNVDIARKKRVPMCQDTGIIIIKLEVGENFPIKADLPSILKRAVKKGTVSIPLRPNAVHPIKRWNTGDNTGDHLPYLEWEVTSGDYLKMEVILKGIGSENMSKLGMLNPGQGIKGVKNFVIESVVEAGGRPCPPYILGLGIGLAVDGVMKLARKAAIRPINSKNEDIEIAKLEEEILNIINKTGIGTMGLGGRTTALAVNIELGYTHTGGLPVGIVFQCWADRRAKAVLKGNGEVEYISHRVFMDDL